MNTKGKCLSIEGSEGCGKTSSLLFIKEYLSAHQIPVITTREPGGTEMAEAIRQLLLTPRAEKVADQTELLMMFAARSQHMSQLIKPALDASKWVVTDRFLDSSFAIQYKARGMKHSDLEWLTNFVLGDFRPDLTILLDCPVELGMARAKNRGKLDRIELESLDFFNRVRQGFLDRAAAFPERIKVVQTDQPLDVVQDQIRQILSSFILAQGIELQQNFIG